MTAPLPTIKILLGIAIGDCVRTWRNKVNGRLRLLGLSQATRLAFWSFSWFHEGRGQAELADRLGIKGPILVRLLERFEKSGLVEQPSPVRDRCCKVVVLIENAPPLLR